MLSRGLIANEIVRRVDPKGRTLGEILRYHISEPLEALVYIGMTEEGGVFIGEPAGPSAITFHKVQ